MASTASNKNWAVDLHIHSVTGLPLSDPIVAVSANDQECRWSSASCPSVTGTAYVGSWATFLVNGSDELELKVTEKAPMMGSFRGGLLSATGALKLEDFAQATAEAGGTDGKMVPILLEMYTSSKGKRVTQALDASMAQAAAGAEALDGMIDQAASKIDGAVVKVTEMATGKSGSMTAAETSTNAALDAAEQGQSVATDTAPSEGAPASTAGFTGIYTVDKMTLRASIRVVPLDLWSAQNAPPQIRGETLEQSITPLPRELHSYAHGGFMGLACSVLGDEKWSQILKEESPEGWQMLQTAQLKLKAKFKGDKPNVAQGSYMLVLENSPVMCAYGMVRGGSTKLYAPGELEATSGAVSVKQSTLLPSTEQIKASAAAAAADPSLQAPQSQNMTMDTASSFVDVALESKRQKSAALSRYEVAMRASNMYGYRPLSMEWDIWVHPERPHSLEDASINHGSKSALVTQAVLTTTGLTACAKKAGSHLILNQGLSPTEWLTQLGYSINRAVAGDRNTPLPLAGPEDWCHKVHITVDRVAGLDAEEFHNVHFVGDVDSDDVVLAEEKTSKVVVEADGVATFDQENLDGDEDVLNSMMSFWPLPKEFEHDDLIVMLRGNPTGIFRDRGIGVARLDLDELLVQHPELAKGEEVQIEVQMGPWTRRPRMRLNIERQRDEEHTAAAANGQGMVLGDDDDDNDEDGAVTAAATTSASPTKPSTTNATPIVAHFKIRFERVGVITAMEAIGVPRAAAQTAVAMLTQPGGLYLDVKSAYSTAYDLQVFVSTLRGIGVTTKAVCSFKPEQLKVGPISQTVLFFHGLSGLENACDSGIVPHGQFVLFNGASFLAELQPSEFEALGATRIQSVLGEASNWPLDDLALIKYRSLCEEYGVVGGFYVQEPDTAPSGVDRLCSLVAEYPDLFPLGFAYGHLSGVAVGFFDANGRGFASQQIVEEFAARKDLSGKTIRRIRRGEHRGASVTVQTMWAGRLLRGENWMSRSEQLAFCTLLAEMQPDGSVRQMVEEVGGIRRIAVRMHQHYELQTPLTLMESGVNWNYSKSMLRLLRNRGVLAALSLREKCELAQFFVGPGMRGYGATYIAQAAGLRRGLHKHAKEGLICLLESCTAQEADAVIKVLGGEKKLLSYLRGWFRVSWRYSRRYRDIQANHKADPARLAYMNPELKYAALPVSIDVTKLGNEDAPPVSMRAAAHTRDKTALEQTWRFARKTTCCAFTTFYSLFLEIITLGTFLPCCVLPRVCGSALKGACGVPAVFAFLLGFIIAIAIIIVLSVIQPHKRDPLL